MQAAQWVALIVAVVGGGFGLTGVIVTLRQRTKSEEKDRAAAERDRAHRAEHDARTEWWRRYQWATEQANDQENPRAQIVGLQIIEALTDSPLVTSSERGIIEAVAKRPPNPDNEDNSDTEGGAR